jgi:hypothetical protein
MSAHNQNLTKKGPERRLRFIIFMRENKCGEGLVYYGHSRILTNSSECSLQHCCAPTPPKDVRLYWLLREFHSKAEDF